MPGDTKAIGERVVARPNFEPESRISLSLVRIEEGVHTRTPSMLQPLAELFPQAWQRAFLTRKRTRTQEHGKGRQKQLFVDFCAAGTLLCAESKCGEPCCRRGNNWYVRFCTQLWRLASGSTLGLLRPIGYGNNLHPNSPRAPEVTLKRPIPHDIDLGLERCQRS